MCKLIGSKQNEQGEVKSRAEMDSGRFPFPTFWLRSPHLLIFFLFAQLATAVTWMKPHIVMLMLVRASLLAAMPAVRHPQPRQPSSMRLPSIGKYVGRRHSMPVDHHIAEIDRCTRPAKPA